MSTVEKIKDTEKRYNKGTALTVIVIKPANGLFRLYFNPLYNRIVLESDVASIAPYVGFIAGMFEEEYPESYQSIREELTSVYNNLAHPDEIAGRAEPVLPIPKRVFRKMRIIFQEISDTLQERITTTVSADSNRAGGLYPRYAPRPFDPRRLVDTIRIMFDYRPPMKKIIQKFDMPSNENDIPKAILHSVYTPFISNAKREYPDFVWGHIVNFYVAFGDLLSKQIKGDTRLEIFDSIIQYDEEEVAAYIFQIWQREDRYRNLLLENLPYEEYND
ncbi:MAG: hypothetical protein CL605_02395 [Altibacter sp.]|nr:hypothetical protein [Altibacter sp.]